MSLEGGAPPQHRRSLWLAALGTAILAPLVVALTIFVLALLNSKGRIGDVRGTLMDLGGIALGAASFSLPAMFVIGMPLIVALRRMRWLTMYPVCVAALAAGMISYCSIMFLLRGELGWWVGIAVAGIAGTIAGLIYGGLAGLRWSSTSGEVP
jgi:hypothetical protein